MNLPTIEYGIHAAYSWCGMPAWPFVNDSLLGQAERSPAHARHAMSNRKPPTPGMVAGIHAHAMMLEPDEFAREYVVVPDLTEGITTAAGKPSKRPKTTDEYAKRLAEFHDQHPGAQFVDQSAVDAFQAMRDQVAQTTDGRGMLEATHHEISVRARLADVDVKIRPDAYSEPHGILYDLKTTADASPRAFAKTTRNMAYLRKMAFYHDAMVQQGYRVNRVVVVAVEQGEPHGAACYELTPAQIEVGRGQYEPLLLSVAQCIRTGQWPSYPAGTRPLDIYMNSDEIEAGRSAPIPNTDDIFAEATP